MSFSKKALLGSLLALSTTSVFAVDSADLRVIGTIAPGACTPTFTGGGTIDYGVITIASLSQTAETALSPRSIGYTITCNAPIPISLTWGDSRGGSVTAPSAARFGLGTHSGANIGRYTIQSIVAGTLGDGAAVALLQRANPTTAWSPGSNTIFNANDGLLATSFAEIGERVPNAYSTYTGTLSVITTINPLQGLDTTTEITLDGLSTMTVNYL